MVDDARFEDASERPVFLKAETAEDVPVISALVQDAVLTASDMSWQPKARRFAFLINRFRWEDRDAAEKRGRSFERVRSLLVLDGVLKVASQGIDKRDKDAVLSMLAVNWTPGEAPTGRVEIVFAGDGGIALEVECLDITLKDVTRPYVAPSHKAPHHPD